MVKKVVYPLLKIGLISLALFFLYQKLSAIDFSELRMNWGQSSITALALFLALWSLNLILDAKAWQIVQSTLREISVREALLHNLKCYGLAFISPVNSGEIVGRYIIQEDANHRKKALFLTFWTHAPKIASKAIICFILLPLLFNDWSPALKGLSFIAAGIGLFLYIRLERWISLLAKYNWGKRSFKDYLISGKPSVIEKLKILALNGLRFLIYSSQLAIVIWGLEITPLNYTLLLSLPVYFFVSALIPSYTGLDFLIKGTLSLYYFELFSDQSFGMAIATTIVWFFNWAIPALSGLASLRKTDLEKIRRKKA